MANLNQVEIRVGPSQFRSTASPVRHVPARGAVDRLNSKKEYKRNEFNKLIKNYQEIGPYDSNQTGERAVVEQ